MGESSSGHGKVDMVDVKKERGEDKVASTSGIAKDFCNDEEDDDEDYMSPHLLANLPDLRPGIVTGAVARRYAAENKERQRRAASSATEKRTLEEAKRKEALAKPVPTDNPGFALLTKMGYRPGQSLGKTKDALTEPIPLEVKNDRHGLGHATELKRKAEELLESHRLESKKRKEQESSLLDAYRSRKRDAAVLRRTETDLRASAQACMDCDIQEGLLKPPVIWFWPSGSVPEPVDPLTDLPIPHDYEDDIDPGTKLQILTSYLRDNHRYCVWCGRKFDSQEVMARYCPGTTRSCHDEDE